MYERALELNSNLFSGYYLHLQFAVSRKINCAIDVGTNGTILSCTLSFDQN